LQEDDDEDDDVEPVPAFKIEIAGSKVPQEKKNVNANRELRSLMPDVKQSTTKKWVRSCAVLCTLQLSPLTIENRNSPRPTSSKISVRAWNVCCTNSRTTR
jgi:hypothetical protein